MLEKSEERIGLYALADLAGDQLPLPGPLFLGRFRRQGSP